MPGDEQSDARNQPAGPSAAPSAIRFSLQTCSGNLLSTDTAGSVIDRPGHNVGSVWEVVAAFKLLFEEVYYVRPLSALPKAGKSLEVALYSVDTLNNNNCLFLGAEDSTYRGDPYDIAGAEVFPAAEASSESLRLPAKLVWRMHRVKANETVVHLENVATGRYLLCNYGTKVSNAFRGFFGVDPLPRVGVTGTEQDNYSTLRVVPPGTQGVHRVTAALESINLLQKSIRGAYDREKDGAQTEDGGVLVVRSPLFALPPPEPPAPAAAPAPAAPSAPVAADAGVAAAAGAAVAAAVPAAAAGVGTTVAEPAAVPAGPEAAEAAGAPDAAAAAGATPAGAGTEAAPEGLAAGAAAGAGADAAQESEAAGAAAGMGGWEEAAAAAGAGSDAFGSWPAPVEAPSAKSGGAAAPGARSGALVDAFDEEWEKIRSGQRG
ncbi:hypothetical protein HYH03_016776 [Edaphochlamys debaryana]|uniref:Uncharacterized protein n=1 Tax=Edaphochlamys debaryana TaxID=47281 RepID=A0A835XJL4_9CHLO|nr:hypothetical protein HYH03_016776 [Edaphochlamys debaryana]|eukprot:KAG2484357.1 hypothetical protein HYH03_016776 [Edaphochlamys debaryana]